MQEAVWKDVTVIVISQRIKTLQATDVGVEGNDEAVYGEGDEPLYIAPGNIKQEGKLTCLKSDLDKMNDAARAAGFRRITDVPPELISIVHTYRSGYNRPLRTDTMTGVKFKSYRKTWEQGASMMKIDLPYNYLQLIET